MFVERLADNARVQGYVFVRGELSVLDFVHIGVVYRADISKDKIILTEKKDGTSVAELDLTTGKSYWNISHCCGATGFGIGRSGLDDKCAACNTPGSKLEATTENLGTVIVDGKYSKALDDILKKSILEYRAMLTKS